MLKNYLIISIRNIIRNKAISFINIFGLAISMSVCLLLIIIIADQYSYDNFHEKKDNTYRIITDRTSKENNVWSTASTTYPLAEALRNHTAIENMAVLKKNFSGVANWEGTEMPFLGFYANEDFLEIFDFPLATGNRETALSQPNNIILTKELSDKIFGQTDPLNKIIEVEDQGQFVVTGVLGEFPGKTHIDFQALISTTRLQGLEQEGKLQASLNDWKFIYDSYIYITIKEEADISDLFPMLDRIEKDNYDPEGDYSYNFKAQALEDITPGPLLSNTLGFGLPTIIIYLMLAMALIVLTSACFNYANLSTARAIQRAREIGIRKVVGARKLNIIGQFMIEAVVISLLAFAAAFLLVKYLHPELNNMFVSLGAPLRFDETPNIYWTFLIFAIVAGLIAGIVPALFFAATDPLVALKKSININISKHISFARLNIRKVLVVVQFSFSIFFVITVLAFYQQMNMIMTTDHGFRTEGIVNVDLNGMDYQTMRNEFNGIASVKGVAATSHMPALGTNNTTEIKADGVEEPLLTSYFSVDQQYLETMELQLLAGRNFPGNISEEENSIIVNQQVIEKIGFKIPAEAIGQIVIVEESPMEIIGVVKDFHYERMDEKIGPMALRHLPRHVNNLIVVINDKNEQETLAAMKEAWQKHTTRPFNYSFYKEDMRQSYGHFEALIKILGYVTIVVVSIACLGLLGMVMFHVQHKSKEIGVRKILGAGGISILYATGKSFFLLIIISYFIGGPLSYFVNEMWLESYAYRIDFGITSLMSGFGIVLGIVALTVGYQLYRAMKLNPVEILKDE